MQKLRESLTLILLGLLPFHALLITVLTKVIAGPDHAPLGWLVIWKEALLCVIALIALFEVLTRSKRWAFDAIDLCILLLALVGVGLFFGAYLPATMRSFAYGFRYDLLLPLCFLVLRRAAWSDGFVENASKVVLGVGVLIVYVGVFLLFLPVSDLHTLGYSDLHSLYVSSGPLAPFQQIGGSAIRRMQSTMSGPNQLGLWLLLPFVIAILKRKWKLAALFAVGIFLTFSRAAWIAAAIVGLIGLWPIVPPHRRQTLFTTVAGIALLLLAVVLALAPQLILRPGSNAGHLSGPLLAVETMVSHPLGLGLGTAGPATNHTADTCVLLAATDDASWAKSQPQLCVFLGDTQVQPTDRTCSCPFLPENWYLQIGVESGFLGLALYLLMIVLLLTHSWKKRVERHVFLALLGVCIAGLFLHSFEDFGVAATLWILLAATVVLPHTKEQKNGI